MDTLPEEVQENILLSLVEPDDLFRACSTSRESRNICSGSAFWREKFAREGLPLLQEGHTFTAWISIYKKAFRAAQIADRLVDSGEDILIRMSEIFDLRHLGFYIDSRVMGIWQEAREGDSYAHHNYIDEEGQEHHVSIRDDFYLVFTPSSDIYTMSIVNYEVTTDNQEETISQTLVPSRFTLKLEAKDMWRVVYNVAFFGYHF
ncbi:hypothetical protein BQ9231_00376 [Cedratvirus lausannensis]|uniref:F-box domain-containing protein n=1 Tax=Cedratvirus lausannensis TaxID=2023205 RepID=A0A285PXB5_9VIRU|nr:DNA-directed RNA polymerase subunit [Cedratvirus borely]SOB74259.1 hypothetical protein BQ9231_00376 [Cedratvirus lausannensis]